MDRDELAAWLRLTLTPGLGNHDARRLLAAFGLPQAVLAQDTTALHQVVGERQATALLAGPDDLDTLLQATLDWLAGADSAAPRRILVLGDEAYPAPLLTLEDPPLMLYTLGQPLTPLMDGRAVAIVGSRNPTPQGEANAQQFARALSATGLTIVSGMALGVDGAAHRGALEGAAAGQLATVAVVGTGLDRVYPKQHKELAHAIARRGALVSEYPVGTPPLAGNFPRRNRLIAGLSRGTLVVEAALQSGSLITARLAAEQGKDVFAIPGSIHSTQSRGCHALLRQGAKLVESAQDVLEELGDARPTVAAQSAGTTAMTSESGGDNSLRAALGFDPVSLDALVARTGMDTASLQAGLLELELSGQVARLPGGLFQRIGKA